MDVWPLAMHCADSTAAIEANAQQSPQLPWYWIGDMHVVEDQSTVDESDSDATELLVVLVAASSVVVVGDAVVGVGVVVAGADVVATGAEVVTAGAFVVAAGADVVAAGADVVAAGADVYEFEFESDGPAG